MGLDLLPEDISSTYEVREWKHALAVLKGDFPTEYDEIISILRKFKLKKSYVGIPGGNVSPVSQFFNREFKSSGWLEKSFDTKIVVDTAELASPTHLVDCFKNRIALEIEWSNKDPFYDRDLNNFRLLFELRAVSVGVIITKSNTLIQTLRDLGIFAKYGMTTTWMSKLLPRIEGGGGGGCPILVFGITDKNYHDDITDTQLVELNQLLASVKKLPKNNRTSANRSIYDLMAAESNFDVVIHQGKQAIEHFKTAVLPPTSDEAEEEEDA
jgi:hypothetical protein